MSVIVNKIDKFGLVKYSLVALEIARKHGLDATSMTNQMASAIRSGKLVVRDPQTGMVSPVRPNMDDPSPWVTRTDVNNWLAYEGLNYQYEEAAKPRITKNKAILQGWLNEGVPDDIESVWQHIRQNAGKDGFPIVRASISTATLEEINEDGTTKTSRITKDNLGRTLARLKKQRKTNKLPISY